MKANVTTVLKFQSSGLGAWYMDAIDLKYELRRVLFFELEEEITKPELWLDIVAFATKLEPIKLVRIVPVSEF